MQRARRFASRKAERLSGLPVTVARKPPEGCLEKPHKNSFFQFCVLESFRGMMLRKTSENKADFPCSLQENGKMKKNGDGACPPFAQRTYNSFREELATLTLKIKKKHLPKQKKKDVLSPASWFKRPHLIYRFYQKRPKRQAVGLNKKCHEAPLDNYLRCLYFANHNKNNDWKTFLPTQTSLKRVLPYCSISWTTAFSR